MLGRHVTGVVVVVSVVGACDVQVNRTHENKQRTKLQIQTISTLTSVDQINSDPL